ncbi:hypothetical protein MIMGU_mgv1a019803mg, partial [Erythranthe guttata]
MDHRKSIISATKPDPISGARELILDQNDVSLSSLASHVIATHAARDKNLVLSPMSINIVLGMIASGSSPARDQVLGFLKSNSIQELNFLSSKLVTHLFAADNKPLGGPRCPSPTAFGFISISASTPLSNNLSRILTRLLLIMSIFRLGLAEEVREEANAWAKKETNGLIKDLLQPEFFLLNGSPIQAPFMTSGKTQYISEFDGFKVLCLPYKRGKDYERRFSMCFFLPNDKNGLPALLKKVRTEPRFFENHIPRARVEVGEFRIPKFKICFDLEASEVLKGLGVMVDDSDTDEGKLLYVSRIFHKAFIVVNELGREAAAVTAA